MARDPERLQRWQEDNQDKMRMYVWKCRGVKGDLQAINDRWEEALYCEVCGVSFGQGVKKHMDHDHDTGEFRYILCVSCNNHDSWKKKIELN